MGDDCMKTVGNIFRNARDKAAEYNDSLRSRERASEQLGVSVSTLSDYELGITKIVPVDMVVKMADLYHCPELRNQYCLNECPIGMNKALASNVSEIEKIAVKLLTAFDRKKVSRIKELILKIAEDGKVDEDDRSRLDEMNRYISDMEPVISEIVLMKEKMDMMS